ncbi:unnamed protein product [Fusarium venenatum]|uniref:Carboxylesterase type B domain-containing protein n=1 Tax=Fusarium venenatum TaxID=56646 RepID=A0A2L2SVI5_9HYPO|nr:uncharacterized protein FVRRES_12426 [Fusarium venenatum]CEI39735.1 unnamed protein product [Fusarium venenatum]
MGNHISYTASGCKVNLPENAGSLKGLQFDSKSRRFAGVPYAQPPIEKLRWRKPQPFPKNHVYGAPFDATQFGPVCPQANYSKNVSEHIPKHAYSEDCLRLNIWTPVPDPDVPNPKWPVMIWFHGGWFQVGDPSQEESMDPTELISTGKLQAIFVAVGYRLNVFGFLAGEALLEESRGEAVGNYGLWDQRLAMDWVYDNISAFGGDPENIILAGRSAGAYSVLAQTLYDFRGEDSQSRFTRMIMYSNAIPTQPKSVQECEEQFDELCEYFDIPKDLKGSEKLDRLRNISSDDLSSAIMELKNHTFRPVTDDLFIHSGIFGYYRDGSFACEFKKRGLKLLIGEVLDEDTLYAVTNPPDPNVASLRLQISNYYPPHVTDRLLKHYALPQTKEKEAWQKIFGRIVADGQVRAPSRYLVDNLVRNGVDIKNVWRYLIAYRLSFINNNVAPASFGVSHAMDRPIWNYSITHSPTPEERQLMDEWISDLRAFVNDEDGHDYGTSEATDLYDCSCRAYGDVGHIEWRSEDEFVRVKGIINDGIVTKTRGYRHDCIPSTVSALKELSFTVTATEDTTELFSLFNYDVIALGHNTGEYLSEEEVNSLTEFVHNGGGVVGIHAATSGMSSCTKYSNILGQVFNGHPPPEWITLEVESTGHFINKCDTLPGTDAAPDSAQTCPFNTNLLSANQFPWFDEVYTFKSHPRVPDKNREILLSVHQTTIENDERQSFPLSWTQTVGRGRVYYTALGHFDEAYRNSWYIETISRAIVWAAKQDQ